MIQHFKTLEEGVLTTLDRYVPRCGELTRKHLRIVRYLIAGGTAAVADLTLLYLFTDGLRIHYLLSSALAFIVAFCISFTLQKFWTFEETTKGRMHAQAILYLVITGTNLGVNAGLMYAFVEWFGLWYFAAQIIAGACIACYSFLLYRHFVFHKHSHEAPPHNRES